MTTRLEKPMRRLVNIRGGEFVVELSPAGIMFRRFGTKTRAAAPLHAVLQLANEYADRDARREQLRQNAIARSSR